MKSLLLAVLFGCISCYAMAQMAFTTSYPIWNAKSTNNLKQTSDGGYILCADAAGDMDSINGFQYVYLIKMDAFGATQWSKRFPKTIGNKSMDGNSVIETSDGGYLIATDTIGSVYHAIYLIKTDSAGNRQWSYHYHQNMNTSGYCIQETSTGHYVVCGSASAGTSYWMYLLKVDQFGTEIWGRCYKEQPTYGGGVLYTVRETADQGYVMCGYSYSGGIVLKTDSSGSAEWCNYGGLTNHKIFDVQQTADGAYIAAGSGIVGNDIRATLTRIDANGNSLWTNSYSSGPGIDDEGFGVVEVSGGYVMLGNCYSTTRTWLMRTDTAGNITWSRKYLETQIVFENLTLIKTSDGGYAFFSKYNTSATDRHVVVIKTNANGFGACSNQPNVLAKDSVVSISPGTLTYQYDVNRVGMYMPLVPVVVDDSIHCPINPKGLHEQQSLSDLFHVYPNPCNDVLVLNLGELPRDHYRLSIFNVLGETVLEETVNSDNNSVVEINSSCLASGEYIMHLQTDEWIVVKEFVKE